jgi:hypothetical protein
VQPPLTRAPLKTRQNLIYAPRNFSRRWAKIAIVPQVNANVVLCSACRIWKLARATGFVS